MEPQVAFLFSSNNARWWDSNMRGGLLCTTSPCVEVLRLTQGHTVEQELEPRTPQLQKHSYFYHTGRYGVGSH